MGDIQTDQGEALELQFVPVDEFNRLLDANVSDVARASAFAALARINVEDLAHSAQGLGRAPGEA